VAWRHRERLRRLALAYAAVAIGYVPWIPSFLVQRQDSAAVRIAKHYPLTAESYGRGLLKVIPGHPYLDLRVLPGRVATWVFVAAGIGAIALAARRRGQPAAPDARALELLALIAIATPVGALLYSLGPQSVFLPRNMIPSLPAAALLLGFALARAGRVSGLIAAAAVLIAVGIGAWKTLEPRYQRPPYRAAARYIEKHGRPGDAVLNASLNLVAPLGPALHAELAPRFVLVDFGRRGSARALARGRSRGHLFVVTPQVGPLVGTALLNRRPELRGFRVVRERVFAGFVPVGVFDYRRLTFSRAPDGKSRRNRTG